MGISVVLRNANGAYEGLVVKTKAPGNGVRLVQEGGRYSFKVDATIANWTLKVEQLTRAVDVYRDLARNYLTGGDG